MTSNQKKKQSLGRLPFFDTLRGSAMILMAIYHFCFDLNNFGLIHQNMNFDEFWLDFRALIMTLFTSLVGVSMFLARRGTVSEQLKNRHFLLRQSKLLTCAAVISVVTYFMFPGSWVYFGILHFIFVASFVAVLLTAVPVVAGLIGLGIITVPIFYRSFYFAKPMLIILGLSPMKPITEDFAPIFPWLGTVLVGIFIGYIAQKFQPRLFYRENKFLSKLGHHSLIFYMSHQVVLFPIAALISYLSHL